MPDPNGSLSDATRDGGREELRDPVRVRPREPHQKYDLDESEMRRDQSYVWVATKARGAPTGRMGAFLRAGYRPCRAADHPELSDYGLYDQKLVDMGVVQKIEADSPVVLDDQMLCSRSKRLTAEAVKQAEQAAEQQYEDHLRRIREKSEREVGKATRISRRYGPHDIVPDDGDLEAH